MENAPPKPPSPPTDSGRRVESTCARMSSTARSPASTSTPARRYAERDSATFSSAHRLFQDELAARRVIRHWLRVVAVEAGEAEPLVRQVERGEHAADREVAQPVRADGPPDLRLRPCLGAH